LRLVDGILWVIFHHKTDRHDIAEILLKVVLTTITTAVYTGKKGGGVQNVHHIHRNRNTGKLVGLAYGG
jgi:hypothetical protein